MKAVPFELKLFLGLLFVVPARLVVPGFGAAGSPSSLLGLVLLLLPGLALIVPDVRHARRSLPRANPVIIGLTVYLLVILASWSYGQTRALSAVATSSSVRSLIAITSLAGVAYFVALRVRSAQAIVGVVDVMLAGTAFMSLVGLAQFFTGVDVAQWLRVPGLSIHRASAGLSTRSIFNRPRGTALHPIEFGVVAAALVPVAWWRARQGATLAWIALGVIALASLTSVSRSAVLALAIGGFVLFLGSSWKDRLGLIVGGGAFVVIAGSVIPGLIGTLRALFEDAGNDPSVQTRLERTPTVLRLISEYRWFGRGFGTFTIEEYLLLDNEIQGLAIQIGVIGVATFLAFVVTVVWAAHQASRHLPPDLDGLGTVLIGSLLSMVVSFYTFDALFYHILMGVLFVNVGLVAVMWALARDAIAAERGVPTPVPTARSGTERTVGTVRAGAGA